MLFLKRREGPKRKGRVWSLRPGSTGFRILGFGARSEKTSVFGDRSCNYTHIHIKVFRHLYLPLLRYCGNKRCGLALLVGDASFGVVIR